MSLHTFICLIVNNILYKAFVELIVVMLDFQPSMPEFFHLCRYVAEEFFVSASLYVLQQQADCYLIDIHCWLEPNVFLTIICANLIENLHFNQASEQLVDNANRQMVFFCQFLRRVWRNSFLESFDYSMTDVDCKVVFVSSGHSFGVDLIVEMLIVLDSVAQFCSEKN